MARLRWDKVGGKHVLLSPERGLSLSDTATLVVRLCDGTLTRQGVVDRCVEQYGEGARAQIEVDVSALVTELLARGLIVEYSEG
jgi:coenzyme PQQ biosynthesis protein PqqD